jgi:hypothetical protein
MADSDSNRSLKDCRTPLKVDTARLPPIPFYRRDGRALSIDVKGGIRKAAFATNGTRKNAEQLPFHNAPAGANWE